MTSSLYFRETLIALAGNYTIKSSYIYDCKTFLRLYNYTVKVRLISF